jgi:hypothetical protein
MMDMALPDKRRNKDILRKGNDAWPISPPEIIK